MTEAPTGYITREYFDLIINGLQKQIGGSSLNVIVNQKMTSIGGATENFSSGDFANVLATDKVFVQMTNDGSNSAVIRQARAANGSVFVFFTPDPGTDAEFDIMVVR